MDRYGRYNTNCSRKSPKHYKVPFIEFVDCIKNNYQDPSIINIACIQIKTSLEETKPPKLADWKSQKGKIIKYIDESIKHGANLIILPELSTSESICNEIIDLYNNKGIVIIIGSYYKNKENTSEILIDKDHYDQIKVNPSYEEKEYMKPSNIIKVFLNTPVGDFAVLICYDATDFSILMALQNYTDFIICIARNRDVNLFDHMFRSITYLKYEYIIFCNDSEYGGSSVYAPFHGNRKLDTLGIRNEGIIYRQLDLGEIDRLRDLENDNNIDEFKIWKYPPASSRTRKSIYCNKSKKLSRFKKSTLNYFNCEFDILNKFLSSIYYRTRITKSASHEITKSTGPHGTMVSSITSMYPSYYGELAKELCLIIREKFLESYIRDLNGDVRVCNSDNKDITIFTQNLTGNYYFLFEINGKKLQDELMKDEELCEKVRIMLKGDLP